MVQAADFRKLRDLPCPGERDRPPGGRIFAEREVSAGLMIVREVGSQDAP